VDQLVDEPLQTNGCQGIPDSLMEYEGYEQRRARLLELLCQLRAATFDLHIAGFLEELGRLQERVNADQFKVLVIGNFKTGKSTFINALLGADILYTAAPPATAFVTEIKFGCPPRALLHYKKEHMNGHDGPRQISIEDLHEEIRIKDYEQDLAQQDCQYDLAEVFYEVDLCRHGVTLIDSPGLNEAESRAKITLDYLPEVDAAVFLTSSNAALGMQEVSALQHVTSLHSAVFLVCNHFDAVRAKERPALVNYVLGVLAKHTNLSKDRVFFTSALRALEGRLDSDEARVSASHLPEFEKALHRFLTHERGKAKLLGAAQQLEAHIRVGQDIIPERLALLSRGLEDLEARYRSKQEPLQRLEMARRLILARFGIISKELTLRVGEEMRGFLRRTIDGLPAWAEAQPVNLGFFGFFSEETLKKEAEPIVIALRDRIANETRTWAQGPMKEMVEAFLKERTKDLAEEIRQFDTAANKILDRDFGEAPGSIGVTGGASMEAFVMQAILSVAAPGVVGALSGVGFLFAAHPIIGILALIVTALVTLFQIETKRSEFKENIAREFGAQIERDRDKMVSDAVAKVDTTFGRVGESIDEELRRQIGIIRGELDSVLAEKRAGEDSVEITRQRMNVIGSELVVIKRKLADFAEEVGAA